MTTPLDKLAARLDSQREAVKRVQNAFATLREVMAEFPDLKSDITDEMMALAGPVNAVVSDAPIDRPMALLIGSNLERIRAFFALRKNRPASVGEIVAETMIPEPSVRHCFNTSNPNDFVWTKYGGNPLKHWKPREETDTFHSGTMELIFPPRSATGTTTTKRGGRTPPLIPELA